MDLEDTGMESNDNLLKIICPHMCELIVKLPQNLLNYGAVYMSKNFPKKITTSILNSCLTKFCNEDLGENKTPMPIILASYRSSEGVYRVEGEGIHILKFGGIYLILSDDDYLALILK